MDLTMHSMPKYRVIVANVNSIVSNYKRIQLLNFLEKNNPDLILINETKLNKRHTLFFKNYNVVKVDRETGKSGCTAIIKEKTLNTHKSILMVIALS